jgi:hypothetical protein
MLAWEYGTLEVPGWGCDTGCKPGMSPGNRSAFMMPLMGCPEVEWGGALYCDGAGILDPWDTSGAGGPNLTCVPPGMFGTFAGTLLPIFVRELE